MLVVSTHQRGHPILGFGLPGNMHTSERTKTKKNAERTNNDQRTNWSSRRSQEVGGDVAQCSRWSQLPSWQNQEVHSSRPLLAETSGRWRVRLFGSSVGVSDGRSSRLEWRRGARQPQKTHYAATLDIGSPQRRGAEQTLWQHGHCRRRCGASGSGQDSTKDSIKDSTKDAGSEDIQNENKKGLVSANFFS
jgi:hypothetical protein